MTFPVRKRNRLQHFDYSIQGAYYVTVCTQQRQPLLSEILSDGGIPSLRETQCGAIVRQMVAGIPDHFPSARVEAFVIMPDHIHMMIWISTDGTGNPSPTVGQIVGWMKYQSSKAINLMRNTPGAKVWQRSYYDHIIRNEQDYAETLLYIEENPIRWIEKHNL